MTTCRGKSIKEITVELLQSPHRAAVPCHADWYEFLRTEAMNIVCKELTVSKAMFESNTDLRRYEPMPLATLHAELNLAIDRKMIRRISTGEIGVSKSCCATCTEGLSALGVTGFSYTVKFESC
jgi:hypothetical protein